MGHPVHGQGCNICVSPWLHILIPLILPVRSRPGSRGPSPGNMRLPRHPKNLNYIVHDQWGRAPTKGPARSSNPKHKDPQRILPDEAVVHNDPAADQATAVGKLLRSQSDTMVSGLGNPRPSGPANRLHIYGSNPANNPISNMRPNYRQTYMDRFRSLV